ncbi:hypothetical protein SEA_TRIBBY_57 [Arthrobacter phage Tribby]|uniref:Uncharacterized protein n=2 Tax=Mudcatvirus TaxID=1982088 RepID=A0A514A3W8_9CAUD|nr:hypothetical protein PQB75_gp057 [Arthrobacter phage Tribby]YP_010666436.1 hypothetical protein PQB78_gp52 [Arthrobacter phage Xenomorph]ASR80508.1 hypothetical protein SEA_TRIBBY_57 [Arthrobacter phage Tribby]QDH47965.1 hypothetical protein SEA_XENOMORPH_52 [Arthrobacter phage Xenomorph]
MSTEQKRAYLMGIYPGSKTIPKMPDYQVHAMYTRIVSRKR